MRMIRSEPGGLITLTVSAVAVGLFVHAARLLVRLSGGTLDPLTEFALLLAGAGEIILIAVAIGIGATAGVRQLLLEARSLRNEWRRWRR